MNQILYAGKPKKNPVWLIVGILLVIIALFAMIGFGIINLWNPRILKGVFAGNVEVSDMTIEEATQAINAEYGSNRNQLLTLQYEDTTYQASTTELGLVYESGDVLAEEAYQYGRSGNIFENNVVVLKSYFHNEKVIETEGKINQRKLENAINALINEDNRFSKNDFYTVSGDKLILVKGTAGKMIDYQVLSEKILTAVKEGEKKVEIPVIVSEPKSLNIDDVYRDVCKDAINASFKSGKNYEIVKEQEGIQFNLDEAKKIYYSLKAGESGEIALQIVEPKIKVADLGDVLFETQISTYTSQYDTSNKNRVTNLEIAANKCNGKILYPGDEFSFNELLGHRTSANGYKQANSFAGGKVVQSLGGGICQVSSTLYNAVLRADLEVTERTAHEMYVQYVPQSTDATVVDGGIDFKFKNNRDYPVKIVTTCENGKVVASIYGYKEETDPTIEVETKIIETKNYTTQNQNDANLTKGTKKVTQQGVNGYVSEAYKVYYINGKETDRKLVSKDTYAPITEIVNVGTKTTTPSNPTTPTQPTNPTTPSNPDPGPNPMLPPGWDNPESGY